MTIHLDRKEQQELLTIVQHSIDYFERMVDANRNPHERSRIKMRARLNTACQIREKLRAEGVYCDAV
jgi:hypothetical protein